MPHSQLTITHIRKRRFLYLTFSTAVLLFLGLIYAFSMFARPMSQDFALSGNIALTFNIMMIAFCFGGFFGSLITKRVGVRVALLVCAALCAVGFCGTGIAVPLSGNVVLLYVFYGATGGVGVGIGYNVIVATTNVWFPDKVGLSSGVMMLGFGVSSLIFGNLALLLRPSMGGMSSVLLVIGIVIAALTVGLALTLRTPPSDIVELMVPETERGKTDVAGVDECIFKTPILYAYSFWAVIVVAVGLATIGNAVSDATALGLEEGFATLLVGLIAAFNGGARILIGLLFDRTNIKVTMLVDGLVTVCAASLIVVAFITGISLLYVPGALLCGFAYGGVPVMASAFSRQRYGAKRYPFNLSIVNFTIALGSLAYVAVVAAAGSDRLMVFVIILTLSLIALADVGVFNKMWRKDMER